MNRKEIISKIKEIQKYSVNISKYKKMIDEIPSHKKDISNWILQEEQKIEDIHFEIDAPLQEMYRKDILGKYFCNIWTVASSHNSLMLMHVTDTFFDKKSQYYSYDAVCKQLGEFLFIEFNKSGDVMEIDYSKETAPWDMKGGYLSSHNLYGILSEGLNGWKEINKETYMKIINKYKPTPLTPKINLDTLPNMCTDFKLSEE